jgi:hypothetical protein
MSFFMKLLPRKHRIFPRRDKGHKEKKEKIIPILLMIFGWHKLIHLQIARLYTWYF